MGRNINRGEGGVRLLSLIIKLAIVAAIVYGIYYLAQKYDWAGKVKSTTERSIDQITNFPFEDINYINTDAGDKVPNEEFINKYKGRKYKLLTDMKKLSEDGDVTYYVYNKDGKYEYKLFDLGDGYIKIVKDTATLYKEVE